MLYTPAGCIQPALDPLTAYTDTMNVLDDVPEKFTLDAEEVN